jgi:beta-lactamase class A
MNDKMWIIFTIIFSIFLVSCNSNTNPEKDNIIVEQNKTPYSTQIKIEPSSSPQLDLDEEFYNSLKQEIEKLIEKSTSSDEDWMVGVVIEDLTSEQLIEINASEVFDAASIGKLPILMLTYEQVRKGLLSENDLIEINENNVERYGTGSIQYAKLPKGYTIRELARLMIHVSDNTASSVLASKVGRQNIAKYVKDIGMIQTNTSENDTVPYDTSIILKNIYQDYKNNLPYAKDILEFMTDTIFEDRISRDIKDNVKVAHKIGTQTQQFHDAGIVLYDKRPYSISIYNKNIADEQQAKDLMANISNLVYQRYSEKYDDK